LQIKLGSWVSGWIDGWMDVKAEGFLTAIKNHNNLHNLSKPEKVQR
jgi:hypothetical protein